ncbi:hypothetical protein EC973_002133 [Apophysomyces ossiformis]|uniref:Invertebrate defensins family profile domain-containing protein n=1 Tax=Apophysomyces ossiformis TaxID=679940 RepID=A0A8H7BNA6_9FUNG|nr:hypothetical protein EC973_002133 [Apophysomyces ossiformis]
MVHAGVIQDPTYPIPAISLDQGDHTLKVVNPNPPCIDKVNMGADASVSHTGNAKLNKEHEVLEMMKESNIEGLEKFTCDVLQVGNTACALRCIITGKIGGYCKKGACHCRHRDDDDDDDDD